MNAKLIKFVDETCNSPYEAERVREALVRCGVSDMPSLTTKTAAAIEDGIRAQKLVDEIWTLGISLRIYEAARAEVSRSKAARRVQSSPMRGKIGMGSMEMSDEGMDSVEDEVKRMRLQ